MTNGWGYAKMPSKKKHLLASWIIYPFSPSLQRLPKLSAPGEDRTHDLQMARAYVIMRLTRYLLRYRGTKNALPEA